MTDLGRRKRWVLGVLVALASVALVLATTFIFFVGLASVRGDDMLPALGDGAGVVVKRRAIPTRGDLILFDDHGVTRIRRVIGLPGEHLEFDGMIPIVNGKRARYEDRHDVELYGRRMTVRRETIVDATHDVIDDRRRKLENVPAVDTGDGYYVMCDFREYGNDSRTYGVVRPDAVVGVVWFAWSRGDRPAPAPPVQ